MKFALNIRELRKSQLLRVIAMLFLLHCGVDLLFPELCNNEPFGEKISSSSLSTTDEGEVASVVAVDASSESHDGQPSESQHRDEDCFCCCTHVMPSPVFTNPGDAELVLSRNSLRGIFIPSAPFDNPYHPPRA